MNKARAKLFCAVGTKIWFQSGRRSFPLTNPSLDSVRISAYFLLNRGGLCSVSCRFRRPSRTRCRIPSPLLRSSAGPTNLARTRPLRFTQDHNLAFAYVRVCFARRIRSSSTNAQAGGYDRPAPDPPRWQARGGQPAR